MGDGEVSETLVLERPVLKTIPEPKKRATSKEEDAGLSPFSVTVGQVYDGPMDLLLDLIRKQNIDIYDIPIGRITAQFLEYCHHLKNTDVDAAGEFVYTASLLIHIKSRMLLPKDPIDAVNGEAEDPRRELVERLLDHERFKAAAQMLQQKQLVEAATWTNPGMRDFREEQGAEREIAADTVDLVRVFGEILTRMRARPVLNVDEESVTVAQMIDYVKRRLLMEDKAVSLRRLLHNTHTERALICMFLAMLELVRLQAVLLHQAEVLGEILVKKADGFDRVMEEQDAVRDDWR
jgi:segregation and condensation protein A